MKHWALLLACLVTSGCIEDFDPPSLIKHARPLGARVEVVGDLTRAWPVPGETVNVRWLVGFPGTPEPLSWAFVVCPVAITSTGQQLCQRDPVAFELQPAPRVGEPVLSFVVPDASRLGGAGMLLVAGVLCASGTPALDPMTMDVSCDGMGATSMPVLLTITLGIDGTNQNPDAAAAAVGFAGVTWDPVMPPAADCAAVAAPTWPTISVGDPQPAITLTPAPTDFESFATPDGLQTEEFLVSHFSTGGELERHFSVVHDALPEASVDWALPAAADVPATGLTVRFYFVERDQRDGIDWTTRGLCVLP